jgi:hypothetical protein
MPLQYSATLPSIAIKALLETGMTPKKHKIPLNEKVVINPYDVFY